MLLANIIIIFQIIQFAINIEDFAVLFNFSWTVPPKDEFESVTQ